MKTILNNVNKVTRKDEYTALHEEMEYLSKAVEEILQVKECVFINSEYEKITGNKRPFSQSSKFSI